MGFRDSGFRVRGLAYGVFEVRGLAVRGFGGSGTGFVVICFGFSRFGVSWFGASATRFRVRGFVLRVFAGSGFRVRSFGYDVSDTWFRDSGFRVRGFGLGVPGFWRFRVSRFRVFEVRVSGKPKISKPLHLLCHRMTIGMGAQIPS